MAFDIKDVIAQNFKSIRKKHNVSLQSLAAEIGVAKSTLSNFEHGKTTPSVEVLSDICDFFQINIGVFVSDYLDENDIIIQKNTGGKAENTANKFNIYNKYRGKYHIYYFKTDNQITTAGMEIKNHRNRLSVAASFAQKEFEGNLSIVGRHTYINLTGTTHFEKVLIILHDPPSVKDYIGGIGIMASVSSGRIQNPCGKKLLISKKELFNTDEIRNLLLIDEDFVVNITEASDDKVYQMIKGDCIWNMSILRS